MKDMMKKSCLILLLTMISVTLFGVTPQSSSSGNDYIRKSKAALDRKDYDESMRWAKRYVDQYHSYTPVAPIAEQMYQEASRIYPNNKKGFVKPMEYAASLGNADALYILGMHYYSGQYLTKDLDKAMALIKAAEKLGHPKAGIHYSTLASGSEWIEHQAKKHQYNDLVVGTVGLVALVAVAAKIIGNTDYATSSSSSYSSSSSSYRQSSSSSYSSSSSSSSSSKATSSSSSSTGKTLSCKVIIKYETIKGNYKKLTQKNIEATFHKNRFSQSGGYKKYWVDTNGNCTITWTDDRGDGIERISFSENGHGYCIKNILLKDDGIYTLYAPWKW